MDGGTDSSPQFNITLNSIYSTTHTGVLGLCVALFYRWRFAATLQGMGFTVFAATVNIYTGRFTRTVRTHYTPGRLVNGCLI